MIYISFVFQLNYTIQLVYLPLNLFLCIINNQQGLDKFYNSSYYLYQIHIEMNIFVFIDSTFLENTLI